MMVEEAPKCSTASDHVCFMFTDAEILPSQAKSDVWLQVIDNAVCRIVYGSSVLDSTLCTSGDGGVGMCGGDDGGPLVISSAGQRVLVSAPRLIHPPSIPNLSTLFTNRMDVAWLITYWYF